MVDKIILGMQSRIRARFRYKNSVSIKGRAIIGKKCIFEGGNVIGDGSSLEYAELGYGTYIARDTHLSNIVIGKYCSIGANIRIISGQHPTKTFVSTHPAFFSTKKQAGFTYSNSDLFNEVRYADDKGHYVVVGSDVWIGSNVTLLGGITISDGAIIAAGAVVTSNVLPYSIVGGVPAKLIRYRFEQDIIQKLMNYKWWDKPKDWIKNNAIMFSNISQFLEIMREDSIYDDSNKKICD